MKIEELRVGNIVYIPQTKTNEQIGCIEENGRFVIKGYKSSYSSIECLRPIPLTEDWLVNFGFDFLHNDLYSFSSENMYLVVSYHVPNRITTVETSEECYINMYNIKYVHQLQNLYFALTGSELQYVA